MKLEDIKAYCIHLSKRTDREENMYKELDYFVPNQYIILEAEKHPIGKIGVSRSFKKAIREAKKNNLEQVLIFEDDVRFTSKSSREAFQRAMESLPDDWDILLGGIYADTNLFDYNDCMKKVESFSALHCVLMRDTVYDKILEHKEDDHKTIHLDTYLGEFSKNGTLNIYVAYPMIAIQYEGKSNTVNKVVDYSNYLKKYDILK
jgi:hypothetical protein